jgi:hypothetical protein
MADIARQRLRRPSTAVGGGVIGLITRAAVGLCAGHRAMIDDCGGGVVYPVMGRDVDAMVSGRHRQRQMAGWPGGPS